MYKIFGLEFGKSEPLNISHKTDADGLSQFRFDACSGNIVFDNDLTTPVIQDYFQRNGYVLFGLGGANNLAPQIFSQLYYRSPLHRRICDLKIDLIQGKGVYIKWKAPSLLSAAIDLTLKKYKKAIASDLTIHSRMYLKITFHKDGEFKGQPKNIVRIPPTAVRHSEGDMSGNISTVTINKHYERGSVGEYSLPVWTPKNGVKDCVYMYQNLTDGQYTYSLPSYIGSANWLDLDGNISEYHRNYLNNSISSSMILSYPRILTPEQVANLMKNMTKKKGPDGAGTVTVIMAPSPEDMPTITTVNSSTNSEQFLHTSEQLQTNICFAHGINPSLLGMKVNSNLGSGNELAQAASLFSDDIVEPMRVEFKEFWDGFIAALGASGELMFGDPAKESTPVVAEAEDKQAIAQAELKGSVGGVQALLGVQTAFAAGTLPREAAIAILELIFGFTTEQAERVIVSTTPPPTDGTVSPGVSAPVDTTQPTPVATSAPVTTNENLKNLTAKQFGHLSRIIRKFDRGEITEVVAIGMLMSSFGLSEEEAKKYLAIESEE